MSATVVAEHVVADPDRLDRPQVAIGCRDQLTGRQAALDVVHVRVLVRDDQRALELPHVLGVDAEVGLQGDVDVHTLRHVDERTA